MHDVAHFNGVVIGFCNIEFSYERLACLFIKSLLLNLNNNLFLSYIFNIIQLIRVYIVYFIVLITIQKLIFYKK